MPLTLKHPIHCSCLFLLLLIAACASKGVLTEIVVPNQFAVKIADYLSERKDTSFTHALLYEDSIRSVIFVVIKESKDSMHTYGLNYNLTDYFGKTAKSLTSKLTQGVISNYYPATINNCKAIVADIKGTNEDEKLYYKLTIVETKENFYQLIYSALEENATSLKPDMETSVHSFKEL